MTFKIQSSAFNEGDSIPSKYTCEEDDIFPPLSWENAPEKTKSFVLIVDDPDAPMGTWDHCLVFNLPETTHGLAENMTVLPKDAQYGKNSWGKSAYGGPCPPSGVHRYYFKLYALDAFLSISAGATKKQIEEAMQGHILAETTLMGRYKKIK
ncbi:MAG TPA: YbhB/YbcL family Raf kinase inhibitor-like protein [Gammaproteobacteria bacterium]|nr:YbhB/YbcL family Raf kinase inhibitor-like protein [Gammaproteobacteria bacterium]